MHLEVPLSITQSPLSLFVRESPSRGREFKCLQWEDKLAVREKGVLVMQWRTWAYFKRRTSTWSVVAGFEYRLYVVRQNFFKEPRNADFNIKVCWFPVVGGWINFKQNKSKRGSHHLCQYIMPRTTSFAISALLSSFERQTSARWIHVRCWDKICRMSQWESDIVGR